MAHKKGVGSSRNGRDSNPQFLGVKVYGGLAVEAARAVIEYALTTLGAAGLFAGHHPANEASRRVLIKLGFHYTHDEFYPPTGLNHPSYRLAAEEKT